MPETPPARQTIEALTPAERASLREHQSLDSRAVGLALGLPALGALALGWDLSTGEFPSSGLPAPLTVALAWLLWSAVAWFTPGMGPIRARCRLRLRQLRTPRAP